MPIAPVLPSSTARWRQAAPCRALPSKPRRLNFYYLFLVARLLPFLLLLPRGPPTVACGGMAAEEECDYLFKAVLVGDAAVGKSNLLSRIAGGEFRLDSKPTIGVEFAYRDVRVGGSLVKAQIWDTAGQERFRAINSSYYRGALGALLVYDITRKSTFINLPKWLQEMREFGNDDMVIMLIGNKSDRLFMREVSEDEGWRFAEQEGLYFTETSALENKNVEEAFLQMVTRIHEIASQKRLDSKLSEARKPNAGQIVIVDEVSATKKETCCFH